MTRLSSSARGFARAVSKGSRYRLDGKWLKLPWETNDDGTKELAVNGHPTVTTACF